MARRHSLAQTAGDSLARPGTRAAVALPSWVRALAEVDRFLLVLVPLLVAVGFWHLDRYPRTWFDEGMYLQVAKNFAGERLYAVRSADGTLDYAPVIGVGPTVLMPAALAVGLLGADLAAARIVPVLAFLIATLTLYLIARRLCGRLAAICTIVIVLTLPALEWIATGRQLLGEVPAVALLLLGGLAAWRVPGRGGALLAGFLFGLTMVTKGQYLLVLPPALGLTALYDLFVTRQRPFRWHASLIAVAGLTPVCWFVALLALFNGGQLAENYRQLRASSGGALLIFDPARLIDGASFLLGPRTYFLAIPATLAGLWFIRRAAGGRRLALVAIWIFQSAWLAWFTFASIAWPRYAFPALVLNTIFAGALVAAALNAARLAWSRRQWDTRALAGAALVLVLVPLVVRGDWLAFGRVARADQREPQQFASEVRRLVPPDAIVDSWEPEIGFLIAQQTQHPPLGTLDKVVRARWLTSGGGGAAPDLSATLRGDYLIVGPFGSWVGIYRAALGGTQYRLVTRVGQYDLYQRIATGTSEGGGARP